MHLHIFAHLYQPSHIDAPVLAAHYYSAHVGFSNEIFCCVIIGISVCVTLIILKESYVVITSNLKKS